MYRKILVPVDLHNQEAQTKGLATAAMIGKPDDAEITLQNIAGFAHLEPARSGEDFAYDLKDYAYRVGQELGIAFNTASRYNHDPAAEVDRRIQDEIEAGDCDLVVMASHVPSLIDYVFSSYAGYLANHAKISVFVVSQQRLFDHIGDGCRVKFCL